MERKLTWINHLTLKEVINEIENFGGFWSCPECLQNRYRELLKFREKKLKEKENGKN